MLQLSLLGTFAASYDGVALGSIGSLRARNLLIYLVLSPNRPHARAALAAFFWPDQPEARGIALLRQSLYILQRWLRSDPPRAELFVTTHLTVGVNLDQLQCDALQLDDLVEQTTYHQHRSIASCPACAQRLQQAAALYRGDLVHGVTMGGGSTEQYEIWLQQQRERLRLTAGNAYAGLVDYQQRHQHFSEMVATARSWLALDTWHEPAQRSLMHALAATGQRAAALRQYQLFCRMLEQELALTPDSMTEHLAASIRAGTVDLAPLRYSVGPQRVPLIGREAEQQQLVEQLSNGTAQLVTIVGIGGVGKSSLALAVARMLESSFAAGAAYVNLDGRSAAAAVLAAIGHVVDCHFTPPADPLEQLISTLHGRELLLLLDGLELAETAVPAFTALRDRLPQLTLLVTSRSRMRLQHESVFELQGLSLPPTGSPHPERFAAVQLFLERAHRHRAGHNWVDDYADISSICQLLDGLPLALELAAQQVRLRSCASLAAELRNSLAPLQSTLHDTLPRHRTIEQLLLQSWQQLSVAQRDLMPALSLFQSTFTEHDAAALLGETIQPAAVSRLLADLADQTLIRVDVTGRISLHALLRQFISERPESQAARLTAPRSRYRQWFLSRLHAANLYAVTTQSLQNAQSLAQQFEDIHCAFLDAVAVGDDAAVSAATIPFSTFARVIGRTATVAETLTAVGCAAHSLLQASTRQLVLMFAASLRAGLEELDAAAELLDLASNCGTTPLPLTLQAVSAITESHIASRRGRHTDSLTAAHRVLELPADPSLPWVTIEAHLMVGRAAMMGRNTATARLHLDTALSLARNGSDVRSLFSTLNESAQLSVVTGDLAEAVLLMEQALIVARGGADPLALSVACSNLGPLLVMSTPQVDRGLALLHESIVLALASARSQHICDRYHSLAFALIHLQRFVPAAAALYRTLPLLDDAVHAPLLLQLLEAAGTLLDERNLQDSAVVAFTHVAFHPATHPFFRHRAVTALHRLGTQQAAAVPALPALRQLLCDLLELLNPPARNAG